MNEQPITSSGHFRIVRRKTGLFGNTIVCEAIDRATLHRTVITLDLVGSNSIAFFSRQFSIGDQVDVRVPRNASVVLGSTIDAEWVAKHAKGYRRWREGRLGHMPNFPHI